MVETLMRPSVSGAFPHMGSQSAARAGEQGGRQPDSAARAYLSVLAKEPDVVRRALASE